MEFVIFHYAVQLARPARKLDSEMEFGLNTTITFKTRLDKFWHNQDIIYNFRAQLQGIGSRSEFSYEES